MCKDTKISFLCSDSVWGYMYGRPPNPLEYVMLVFLLSLKFQTNFVFVSRYYSTVVSWDWILGSNCTKVLRVFLLAIHSHLYSTNGFYSPPWEKSGLKLVCNVNIVCGNRKYENYQDYAQKPQRNCMFMNSASGMLLSAVCLKNLA